MTSNPITHLTGPPRGVTRRRFLGGALATVGTTAVLPTWLAQAAGASTVAPSDGLLLVITLGGGNDALNTFTPRSGPARAQYEYLRGPIALNPTTLLPASEEYGFHPSLVNLAARYAAGNVAVVQGAGRIDALDLSHFSSMATLMAGSASSARDTGWLGRYLDGMAGWETGLRGVAFGPAIPLHLVGQRAEVTSVPTGAAVWAADSSSRWERAAHDALRSMGGDPTQLGSMADRYATRQVAAIERATTVGQAIADPPPIGGLIGDLIMAARLLSSGLGVQIVHADYGSFDLHAFQDGTHAALLAHLDAAIEHFFRSLPPKISGQAAVLVVSEFGRRAQVNGSLGTDHGAAGHALVIGDRVRGGLHGSYPSLSTLDSSGSLAPTVDQRSIYATILEKWLGADAHEIIGSNFEQLDLFASGPGG